MQIHEVFVDTRPALMRHIILPAAIVKHCTVRHTLPAAMTAELVRGRDHRAMVNICVGISTFEIIEGTIRLVATHHTCVILCFQPVVSNEQKVFVLRSIIDYFGSFNIAVILPTRKPAIGYTPALVIAVQRQPGGRVQL
jgi:hypothetical protein